MTRMEHYIENEYDGEYGIVDVDSRHHIEGEIIDNDCPPTINPDECYFHYDNCEECWKVSYIDKDSESVVENVKCEFDVVDKPKHYTDKRIEVIEYMEDTLSKEGFEGYCVGNVIKYVSRYRHKNGVEDLKKARYYLDRVIKFLESDNQC